MNFLMRIINLSDCSDGSSRTSIRDEKGGDNNDDVSDVDDVDLECRWHSPYRSADCRNREAAEKIIICAAKIGQ